MKIEVKYATTVDFNVIEYVEVFGYEDDFYMKFIMIIQMMNLVIML